MNGSESLGMAGLWGQADAVGKAVLLLMLAMSVATWYLVAVKTLQHVGLARHARAFLDAFWRAPTIDAVERTVSAQPQAEPFGRLARRALAAAHHARRRGTSADRGPQGGMADGLVAQGDADDAFVARAMRRSMDEERAALDTGLPVLATIGAVAPFVGLFGTVWGVFHALKAIGLSGQGTLDKVAGPVGEALVMTAIGLAVAIPAVVGYNAFVRRTRVLMTRLDGFAHDVHALVTTGAPVTDAWRAGRDARSTLEAPTGGALADAAAARTRHPGAPRAAEG